MAHCVDHAVGHFVSVDDLELFVRVLALDPFAVFANGSAGRHFVYDL